jgi:hypothetical protein
VSIAPALHGGGGNGGGLIGALLNVIDQILG